MDIQSSTLGKCGNTSSLSSTMIKATSAVGTTSKPEVKPEVTIKEANTQPGTKEQPMSEQDITKTTEHLNKIIQLLNADLKFEMHEKTQRLMVRLVDTKTDKILKEFPPHELLDTLAAIKEYIGFLLDKKA